MATYTSAATGLWSAGATWVGGVKPPSGAGHKIVIAVGHTVTYDETAGTYGDDTSSATAANNAIVVYGTLKFSRLVSTQLTCRGTLYRAAGGTLDAGSTADPIPAGVTCTLLPNDSATLARGKHGIYSQDQTGGAMKIRGVPRTRNTRLTSATSAGATAITVDASANWAIGDQIVIASDTDDPTRSQVVTISGGSSPTWTVPAITNARAAGCRVGNLSSNVVIRPSGGSSYTSFVAMHAAQADTTAEIDIGDVRLEEMGSATGWAGTNASYRAYGLSISAPSVPASKFSVSRVAIYNTSTYANVGQPVAAAFPSLEPNAFSDFAIYAPNATCLYGAAGTNLNFDAVIYSSATAIQSANSDGVAYGYLSGEYWANSFCVWYSPIISGTITANLRTASGRAFTSGSGSIDISGATINAALLSQASLVGTTYSGVFRQCNFSSALLSANNTVGAKPAQKAKYLLDAVNGVASDNRVLSYFQTTVTDTSTRKRSTYSVKIQPKVANTAIVYTFTLPAVASVAQTIKGSLRFDATYGTATPPSIALSGQGVTASFTAPATADAWHDFALTFTPSSTGDITATVTVQSASTSGFAWLDGIYHYPMTQSVRHYGYQWLPQAAQLVDSRITLTEAAALALPIVVDHGAETITITGSATAREVFEACMADLAQTANQGEAVHISSATGATFESTYTVVGAVVGPYTDAAGLHVSISAAAIVSGSRVQLYNVTDAAEMLNTTLGSTGLTYATTWTADKTVRLRADHPDYLPLEATGILTASGLTFLSTQAADTVYVGNGIDGSTVTEFTADALVIHVDVDDPDGYTLVQRLYAWLQHYQTTSAGIASAFFGAMVASDSANYVIDQDKADIHLDNVAASPLMIVGGYLTRKDGSTVIAATSGSIQMDPGRAYVAPGGAAITVPEGERVILLQASGAHIARG